MSSAAAASWTTRYAARYTRVASIVGRAPRDPRPIHVEHLGFGHAHHPTTLRRKPVTRSIRHRDLTRSAARIRVHEAARAVCAHRRQLRPERDRRGLRTDLVRHESGDVRTGNAARHPGHGERRTAPRRGSPHGCDPLAPPVGDGRGRLLVHLDGHLLTWFDANLRHARRGTRSAGARQLRSGGVSQDGSRAVVARTQRRSTTFAIVSRTGERRVVLARTPGASMRSAAPSSICCRTSATVTPCASTTSREQARAAAAEGRRESALISGIAWTRQSSRTAATSSRSTSRVRVGRWCTSSTCAREPRAASTCPRRNFNSATTYALVADPDGRTLWAASPGDGKVVSIDVAAARVRDSFGFSGRPADSPGSSVAAIAPDGGHLAVSSAGKLWFVTLAKRARRRCVRGSRSHSPSRLTGGGSGRSAIRAGSRPCPSLRPRAPPRSRSRSRSSRTTSTMSRFALNTRS